MSSGVAREPASPIKETAMQERSTLIGASLAGGREPGGDPNETAAGSDSGPRSFRDPPDRARPSAVHPVLPRGRRPPARAGSPPAEGCVFLDRPGQTFHARIVGDRILTLGPSLAPCVRGDPGRRVGRAAAAEGTGCDAVVLCRRGYLRAERFGVDACRGRVLL